MGDKYPTTRGSEYPTFFSLPGYQVFSSQIPGYLGSAFYVVKSDDSEIPKIGGKSTKIT